VGGEPTFAEAMVNSEVAPIPAVRMPIVVTPETDPRLKRPLAARRDQKLRPNRALSTICGYATTSGSGVLLHCSS
jgi:hypothetical protein